MCFKNRFAPKNERDSRCCLQNGRKTFETIPSAPRLRLKASGMAERLLSARPHGRTPRGSHCGLGGP